MKPWFEARTLDEVRKALDEHGVCWGPYQTFTQLLDDDWRASVDNPVFGSVSHPGIGPLLTPTSPLRFADMFNEAPGPRTAASAPTPTRSSKRCSASRPRDRPAPRRRPRRVAASPGRHRR